MTIELVTKPFVSVAAVSRMHPTGVAHFIDDHGLADLAKDLDTPIGRIDHGIHMAEHDEIADMDVLSEFAGRFCYRSWGKGRSHEDYIANILNEQHGNVLAHANVSLIITGVSRSLTHELVRHHVGTNPSQESQRYVTAEGGELEVTGFMAHRAVVPPLVLKVGQDSGKGGYLNQFEAHYTDAMIAYGHWLDRLKAALPDDMPKALRKKRAQEAARCFLPNAAETRLVWTMNMRAARWPLEQRGSEHADLEIRRLAVAIYRKLEPLAPATLADVDVYQAGDGFEALRVVHSKV